MIEGQHCIPTQRFEKDCHNSSSCNFVSFWLSYCLHNFYTVYVAGGRLKLVKKVAKSFWSCHSLFYILTVTYQPLWVFFVDVVCESELYWWQSDSYIRLWSTTGRLRKWILWLNHKIVVCRATHVYYDLFLWLIILNCVHILHLI